MSAVVTCSLSVDSPWPAPPSRPRSSARQTPKRGGTLSLRTWDPPHFDPFQTISYKTHIALSFTHSRLLKHKAGPSVVARHVSRSRATWPSRGRSPTRRPTSSSCGEA